MRQEFMGKAISFFKIQEVTLNKTSLRLKPAALIDEMNILLVAI